MNELTVRGVPFAVPVEGKWRRFDALHTVTVKGSRLDDGRRGARWSFVVESAGGDEASDVAIELEWRLKNDDVFCGKKRDTTIAVALSKLDAEVTARGVSVLWRLPVLVGDALAFYIGTKARFFSPLNDFHFIAEVRRPAIAPSRKKARR